MNVYSIWESRFSAETADDGIRVTQAIWRDMLSFDGYMEHELIQDLDQPGHLFVVSRWTSREAADARRQFGRTREIDAQTRHRRNDVAERVVGGRRGRRPNGA